MTFWAALALVALGFVLGYSVDREGVADDVAELIARNRDRERAQTRDC